MDVQKTEDKKNFWKLKILLYMEVKKIGKSRIIRNLRNYGNS